MLDKINVCVEKEKYQYFNEVVNLIKNAKEKAISHVNKELINLYWNIGEYVYFKVREKGWGKSTIDELSKFILNMEPNSKGFSSQNIWRMKQFYETYKDYSNISLLDELTWTNNIIIMSKTKTIEEKEFYLKLTIKEKYSSRELERQIDSGYYERLVLSNGKAPKAIEPKDIIKPIRDMYMLEFLDLPEPYKEHDLQEAIILNMKKFILEFGKDFLFMGSEYKVQVGMNDYYVDLLFYHRELQCLIAIDLKIDDFKPEYKGKMDFYLEALDRDVKKDKENPSVGIILCKKADKNVVEYTLSKSMSQTMIAEYTTKLISKEILGKALDELYELAEEELK